VIAKPERRLRQTVKDVRAENDLLNNLGFNLCVAPRSLVMRLVMYFRVVEVIKTEVLSGERDKRDVYCDKQREKAVTALNCVLKGSWGEVGSEGIRKKLKSEYVAYLESKYRRNDRSSI